MSTNSSSLVLEGTGKTTPKYTPGIISSLQNRSIISIGVGDYHFSALTVDGTVLTWGKYSSGALGLGDPRDIEVGAPGGYRTLQDRATAQAVRRSPPTVEEPAEVSFNHSRGAVLKGVKIKKQFAFAVTAGGWHSGALSIDTEVDIEPNDQASSSVTEAVDETTPEASPGAIPVPQLGPEPTPLPQVAGRGEFAGRGLGGGFRGLPRLGFPARGAARGRGATEDH